MIAVAAAAMMLYWMAHSHSLKCELHKQESTYCEVISYELVVNEN
jgi:hypothetical protein